MSLTEKQIEEIKESLIESKEEIEKDLKDSEKNLDFGDDYGSAWEEEETDEAEDESKITSKSSAIDLNFSSASGPPSSLRDCRNVKSGSPCSLRQSFILSSFLKLLFLSIYIKYNGISSILKS
jgi:hypothetical protein